MSTEQRIEQQEEPPKLCGNTLGTLIDCARRLEHEGYCVDKTGWCDRHQTHVDILPRDGAEDFRFCKICLVESVQQLRVDNAAILNQISGHSRDMALELHGLHKNIENIDSVLSGAKPSGLGKSLMVSARQAIRQATEEAETRLRNDDAGIREGIAATRKELMQHIGGIADNVALFARQLACTESSQMRNAIKDVAREVDLIKVVLHGTEGEDGCGMFRTYNAAINDLRAAIDSLSARTARAESRQKQRGVRAHAVALLRWVALRIEATQ